MNKIKTFAISALAFLGVLLASAPAAQAGGPFRWGVKAGVNINELKFNEKAFSADNRSGFTGGLTLQFVAPIINIGVDASLMYTHRNNHIAFYDEGSYEGTIKNRTDYIEIPINFRWNIGIPAIGKFFTPFLFTGPDFSFLLSNQNVKNAWNNRKFDMAWNFGLGFKLIDRVELAASYGLGLTNSASPDHALYGKNLADGKNRFWTVTAAWLF